MPWGGRASIFFLFAQAGPGHGRNTQPRANRDIHSDQTSRSLPQAASNGWKSMSPTVRDWAPPVGGRPSGTCTSTCCGMLFTRSHASMHTSGVRRCLLTQHTCAQHSCVLITIRSFTRTWKRKAWTIFRPSPHSTMPEKQTADNCR